MLVLGWVPDSPDVRFRNQGLDLVEVQDNGSGIAPANYASVALKHHTSKLSSYADIASLQTFGFRGEALASLCALSTLSVTTCLQADVPKGSQLTFGPTGKLCGTKIVAAQRGTTVSVDRLFHNLPVRRRELERNVKREWHKVITLLNQYACIQTGLKISASQQPTKGKHILLFSTKGNSTTRDNIINIFGAKTMSALVPLNLELDMHPSAAARGPQKSANSVANPPVKVRVTGHVSRPSPGDGRQTPDRQMFFINGRPCGLPQFSKTFNEVYRSYNYSQSPFILADIRLDTHMYDVNVSPDKRTILLHDQGRLLDSLRDSLVTLFDSNDYAIPVSQTIGRRPPPPNTTSLYRPGAFSLPGQKLKLRGALPDSATRDFDDGSEDDASQDPENHIEKDLIPNLSGRNRFPLAPRVTQDQNLISQWLRRGESEGFRQPTPGPRVRNPISGSGDTEAEALATQGEPPPTQTVIPTPEREYQSDMSPIGPRRMRGLFQSSTESSILSASSTTRWTDKEHSDPGVAEDHGTVEAAMGPPSSVQLNCILGDVAQLLSGDAPSNETADESETVRQGQVTPSLDMVELDSCTRQPPGLSASGADGEGNSPLSPRSDPNKTKCSPRPTSSQLSEDADDVLKISRPKGFNPTDRGECTPPRSCQTSSPRTRPVMVGTRQGNSMTSTVQLLRVNECTVRSNLCHLLLARSIEFALPPGSGNVESIGSSDAESKLTLIISRKDFLRMRVVGQFNMGFIIAVRPASVGSDERQVANHDELLIIDQHASDEKYNFERLQTTTNVQSQRLVHPKRLQLTALEEEIVMENPVAMEANGFEVQVDASGASPVGSRCQVMALPLSRETTFSLDDLQELISLLGEESAESNNVPRPSRVRKMFAMRACRSSIMIGKALTVNQMRGLLKHMGELDKPWNCPHGRPTMRHLCRLGMWDGRGWKGDLVTTPLATWGLYVNGH